MAGLLSKESDATFLSIGLTGVNSPSLALTALSQHNTVSPLHFRRCIPEHSGILTSNRNSEVALPSQAIVRNRLRCTGVHIGCVHTRGTLCKLAYMLQGTWYKLNDVQPLVKQFELSQSSAVQIPTALSLRKPD